MNVCWLSEQTNESEKRKDDFQKGKDGFLREVNNIYAADKKKAMLINKWPLAFSLFFFTKLKRSQEYGPGHTESDCNYQVGGNPPREEVGSKDIGQLLLKRTPNEAWCFLASLQPSSFVLCSCQCVGTGPLPLSQERIISNSLSD